MFIRYNYFIHIKGNPLKIVLFDFETNGKTASCSVLESMLLKIDYDRETQSVLSREVYHKYYLPIEEFDFGAYLVHKLSMDILTERREGMEWPEYFRDDLPNVLSFLDDVDVMVAHNINYDIQFLPRMLEKVNFCTMKSAKGNVGALNINGNLKNPTLKEACTHYGLNFDSTQAHGALYDTQMLEELFFKEALDGLVPFLQKVPSPKRGKGKNTVPAAMIRTKIGEAWKEITNPIYLPVDEFTFIITPTDLCGSTDTISVYEKRSGNLFYSIDRSLIPKIDRTAMVQSDIDHIFDRIQTLISKIGRENLKEQINKYADANGEVSQKTLFDF